LIINLAPQILSFAAEGRAFLGRLEHFGRRHEDRSMRIMPASVHHTDLAPEISSLGLGRKGKAVRLLDRQRVQFGTQRYHRPRLAAFEDRDNAGAGDASFPLKAKAREMRGDQAGGPSSPCSPSSGCS
jgi:hypothetical protein